MNKEKGFCSSPVTEKPLVAQKMDKKALKVIEVFSSIGLSSQRWQNIEAFWDSAAELAELFESFMGVNEGSMNQKFFKTFVSIRVKLDELYAKYEREEFRDLSHMQEHKLFKDLQEMADIYVKSYKNQKFK